MRSDVMQLGRNMQWPDWLAVLHFVRFPIWLYWFFFVVQQAAVLGESQWFMGHPLFVLPGLYSDTLIGHLLLRRYRVASAVSACENSILIFGGVLAFPAIQTLGPLLTWTAMGALSMSFFVWLGLSIVGVFTTVLAAVGSLKKR